MGLFDIFGDNSISGNSFSDYGSQTPSLPSLDFGAPIMSGGNFFTTGSSPLSSLFSTPSPTAPVDSGFSLSGMFGGVSDAASSAWNTMSGFFGGSSPANSSANAASVGAGLLSSIKNLFSGAKSTVNRSANAVGSGISSIWGSATQGLGTGAGNIVGGAVRPLIPALILIVIGGIVFFLIQGRMLRGGS